MIPTPADPRELGLETTAEEWSRLLDFSEAPVYPSSFIARAKRDFDRLTAALSEAREREIEDAITIGRLNSGAELQAVMAINNKLIAREAAAREEEREACAKIADHYSVRYPAAGLQMTAVAIRARSQP